MKVKIKRKLLQSIIRQVMTTATSVPIQWKPGPHGTYRYRNFEVDGINYSWTAVPRLRPYKSAYQIIFSYEGKVGGLKTGSLQITGEAGSAAVRVLSIVVNLTLKFLRQTQPKVIHFSAKQPSRKRLYRSMVKSLRNRTDYEYNRNISDLIGRHPSQQIQHQHYVLVKPGMMRQVEQEMLKFLSPA